MTTNHTVLFNRRTIFRVVTIIIVGFLLTAAAIRLLAQDDPSAKPLTAVPLTRPLTLVGVGGFRPTANDFDVEIGRRPLVSVSSRSIPTVSTRVPLGVISSRKGYGFYAEP